MSQSTCISNSQFKMLFIPFLTPKTQMCGFSGQFESLNCVNAQPGIAGKEYLWSANHPLIIKG